MPSTVDTERLSIAVRTRRGSRTLRDAAADAGVDKQTFSNLEKGGKPSTDTLLTICDWLDMPADYFSRRAKATA